MPRPVILGVVGDSATGKTTITDGLVRVLGKDNIAHIGTDDYHRYDRDERKELGITPLNPEANYMDIMAQDLERFREGKPILKPIYVHSDGTFDAPEYVEPKPFAIVEGLLGYYNDELREAHDVRVSWLRRSSFAESGILIETPRSSSTRWRRCSPSSTSGSRTTSSSYASRVTTPS